jgi:transposase
LTRLLPNPPLLRLDAWHTDDPATQLTWQLTSTQTLGHCPVGRFPTRRVHRRYARTVADLPWGPWRVVLHLQGRKFFCANGRCTRRLCPERLAPRVALWARRTPRLVRWLVHLAVELAGTAGARLSRGLGLGVSRHTLLRWLRRLPLPDVATPQGLDIDDWAVRTGQTSGPVLIALERHRPLALRPAREAKTMALWWQAPPGVRVISRDRSRASADGAQQGAPDAIQVADRVYLRPHLADALDQGFNPQHHALQAVHQALRQGPVTPSDGTVAVPVPPPSPPNSAQELAYHRRDQRLALSPQIGALPRQGWPGHASAT